MKISMETSKKYCTGLLANSPCVEQCGEEEAIGEHHMEQSTPISAKAHKTQSRKKPKPYKVEIHSSVSKEHFVDDEKEPGNETPAVLQGRKIKRKTTHNVSQESTNVTPKKCSADSSGVTESPSGVGIFSFDMPNEYHSNLHQLAMASQLVSQSPSGEVPSSVIKAIEYEQRNQQEQKKPQEHHTSPVKNHEKPTSLVLSIPRSPLISISGRQSTSTTPASLQPAPESSAPSSVPAIPSPVIVSCCTGKASSSLKTAFVTSATHVGLGSPDSGESVFIYPNSTKNDKDITAASQLKRVSKPRADSVEPSTSNKATTKTSHPCIVTTSTSKPTEISTRSANPVVNTPATVTQNGAFFECPPPISMVSKPTSIQVCRVK